MVATRTISVLARDRPWRYLAPCRDFSEGLFRDKKSKIFCNKFAWDEDIVTMTMPLLPFQKFLLPNPSF